MTKYLALSGYIALGRNDINDNNCNSATAATKKKAAKITKKQHQQPNIDCHLLRFRIIADARHFSVLQNDQTCCVPPPPPGGTSGRLGRVTATEAGGWLLIVISTDV